MKVKTDGYCLIGGCGKAATHGLKHAGMTLCFCNKHYQSQKKLR